MIQFPRNLLRLAVIAWTLVRYDALQVAMPRRLGRWFSVLARADLPKRAGARLALALTALGPTFVKLGQALSMRADLLGDEVTADLAMLRDRLPPFSSSEVRAIIERELGAPVEELFESFDEEPVAAASIAQVHFAVTTEGKQVAVKVRRPGIRETFKRDMALFHWIARLLPLLSHEFNRLRPVEAVAIFSETTLLEMDFRYEAAAASELADNFQAHPEFRVPYVDWARTGEGVMTLERIIGTKAGDLPALHEAGHDLRELVATAARIFFLQVFRDGYFHADMHPGNLFVAEGGVLRPVDFGIMGRLDRPTRRFLAEMLRAFLDRDFQRVAEVHIEAGYIPADKSVPLFAQACRAIAEPILDRPLAEISIARLLSQLFQITRTFDMPTQPQLLLLQKTMLQAEGMGRLLAPDVNMWKLAEPLIMEQVPALFGPRARLRDAVETVSLSARRLPVILERVEELLDETDPRKAGRAGRNLVVPLWLAVALLLAILVLQVV